MKKRILLISYNYHPEPTGIGKYNGEMIEWFVEQGYDCTVLTSYPYYPHWKVQEPYYKKRFWYSTEEKTNVKSNGKLKIIRCPLYVPAQPSGLKRILLDLSFQISALFPLLGLIFRRKFEFIISIAPSFQQGLLGVIYKKLKGGKLVYHIQDMQIEAARDLNMIKSKALIKLLFKIEKYIFDQSGVVSSISDGMVEKIQQKAKKEVFLFPNWTDTRLFYPIANRAEIKKQFGYKPSDKIVLYSGSIGEKQGLDAILHAANDLRGFSDLKFIICGSGPYKKELQKIAEGFNLNNVDFLPTQPFEKFNQFLNLADLHLIIQKASASDLVMPSKLTTILAVGGIPLITANEGSGLYALVKEHKVGLIVEAENQAALNEGILKGINEDLTHLNTSARAYAEDYLSIENIMGSFEQFMLHQKKVSMTSKRKVQIDAANGTHGLDEHAKLASKEKVQVELGTKS
ncbi:MAG TPA: WcaI family glycosyltransferase [Chryseolinea sp.]|nr:WcaI family glycosyltransferase [Chryseolinea sp.]